MTRRGRSWVRVTGLFAGMGIVWLGLASSSGPRPEFGATIPNIASVPQISDPNFPPERTICQTCHLEDPTNHVVIPDLAHMTPFGVAFHDINNGITTDITQWHWRPEVA